MIILALFLIAVIFLCPLHTYVRQRLDRIESDQPRSFPWKTTGIGIACVVLALMLYRHSHTNLIPIGMITHDTGHFTQGFATDGEYLYETTGLYGQSGIYKYDLKTNKLVASNTKIGELLFLEGCTILNGKLYVLTWKENKMFGIDPATLEILDEYLYPREGWGLANDGTYLIASDGTSAIYFFDNVFGDATKQINVTYQGKLVNNLNELEYIDGKIWANRWYEDDIYIIDPDTGECEKILNLSAYAKKHRTHSGSVLNGIAFDKSAGNLLITGKLWDTTYAFKIKK